MQASTARIRVQQQLPGAGFTLAVGVTGRCRPRGSTHQCECKNEVKKLIHIVFFWEAGIRSQAPDALLLTVFKFCE